MAYRPILLREDEIIVRIQGGGTGVCTPQDSMYEILQLFCHFLEKYNTNFVESGHII